MKNQEKPLDFFSRVNQHRTFISMCHGFKFVGWKTNYLLISQKHIPLLFWLVDWTPVKNMKVSWDDEIPNLLYIWENKKWQPNHQPDFFLLISRFSSPFSIYFGMVPENHPFPKKYSVDLPWYSNDINIIWQYSDIPQFCLSGNIRNMQKENCLVHHINLFDKRNCESDICS